MVTLLGSFNTWGEKVAGSNPKLITFTVRAFSRRFHPKRVSDRQHIHSSEEVRVRCLAHGHLDRARDQTSNVPVKSQPFINDLLCFESFQSSSRRFRQCLLDDSIET